MKLWRAVFAIAPAPIVAWFNAWLTPFHDTGIALPNWQADANNLAAIFATVLVIILYVYSEYLGRRGNIGVFVILVVCLLVGSFWLYETIGDTALATEKTEILNLQSLWKRLYIVDAVLMLATIFWGLKLLIGRDSSKAS